MITVMRFNHHHGWSRGFYSDHFDEKLLVEMEASIVAKMFIDKQRGWDTWDNYLLIFKSVESDWYEITNGVKLEDFCNSETIFGFIKLD